MALSKVQFEKREGEFLRACGFDLSNGFWSEDVSLYKRLEPELYFEYVIQGA